MNKGNDVFANIFSSDVLGGHFKIPDGTKRIGAFAFLGCQSLSSVIIPDSVKNIGAFAFCGCTNLNSVIIPDSITNIDNSAFFCTSLISRKANYKAFYLKDGDPHCLGKKYEECEKHLAQGDIELKKTGIVYFTNLFELFDYFYGELDKDIAIYEIEVGDKVVTTHNSSKCHTNSCFLKKRLYRQDIIKILNVGNLS